MSEPIIEIENLALNIEGHVLFSKFDLSLKLGERVGITGPSGCGKTTLIKSIIKNEFPEGSSKNKFTKNKNLIYSYAPQTNGLLPWFSLRKNLHVFKICKDLYEATIDSFKIQKSLDNFPHQLSGGEYQRAVLASSIIYQPDFFIADEPLTELDITSKWGLLSYWSDKIKSSNSTLLLVSHDIETLIYMCDRIIVLSDKPSTIKREFYVSEKHPRQLDFLVSEEFINSKKLLLDIIENEYFQVGKDYETSEHTGAGGMFQVDTLIDSHGLDVTDRIDVGIHFRDNDHLKEYLSQIFGIPADKIDIDDL